MPNYEPNLDLFRRVFGSDISDCRAELIKSALGWSCVYRLTLTREGQPLRESVIVKTIDSAAPLDKFQAERELRFYETLHPRLDIPKARVHFLHTDEAAGVHLIILEDLAPRLWIPAHPYQWTAGEIKAILRAYAQLHTSEFESLEYDWLTQRHESMVNFDSIPDQVALVQRAGIWADLPHLRDLIAFARAGCEKYAHEKLSLLHGDTTPANAALPHDPESQAATLIDWQDVGIGMPEFDLAYMDLQPFDSARLIPRSHLLDHYWHYRIELDPDKVPPPEERRLRQLHADVITALWLTAPAARVAVHPYPLGSYPQIHWASQYGIVYNRLISLAQEIPGG